MPDRNGDERGRQHIVREDRRTDIERVFDMLGLRTDQQRQAKSFREIGYAGDSSEHPQRFIPRLSNTSDFISE
ncbi:MAG: hypothetical protein ACKVS9_05345 [Phycisphaerae bacterium]